MVNFTHEIQRAILVMSIATLLTACEQKGAQGQQPPSMPAMPVTLLAVQPATVPIQAEAVAQTEGAKEIEIRPRVGGIIVKKLFEEGAQIKAGQAMFIIDPVPYQVKATQARAQLAQQKARLEQTRREAALWRFHFGIRNV